MSKKQFINAVAINIMVYGGVIFVMIYPTITKITEN